MSPAARAIGAWFGATGAAIEKLLGGVPPRWRAAGFLALLVVTGALGAKAGGDLITPDTPQGIVSLELARTEAAAGRVTATWSRTGRVAQAARAVAWDFPFIGAYATTLVLGCLAAASTLDARRRWAQWARRVAWLQVAAAALDAVENMALSRVLAGDLAQPWPGLAFVCAVPKFVIVAAGIALTLVGLPRLLRGGWPGVA